jgi:hypothetical protein
MANPNLTPLDTVNGPVLVNPRSGQAQPVTMGGQAVPPKPTEASVKAAQPVKDANDVLALLNEAEPLIGKATSSRIGALYDAAAGAVGASPDGAPQAAQLRAIEGALVSKMPKMSGPQSDKDVLLYKQMAGQIGDPNIPVASKRAAMATIRSLNERYAGVAPGSSAPGASKGPAVGTVQQGYRFMGGNPADQASWVKI